MTSQAKSMLRIGLLVESLTDRFWHEVVVAVAVSARRRGVQLLVFVGGTLDGSEVASQHENRTYDLARLPGLDGLLVAPLGSEVSLERLLEFYQGFGAMPMVALTSALRDVPSVCTDNRAAMAEAVEHLLLNHGARRIAFVRGPTTNSDAEQRFSGYEAALAENNVPLEAELIVHGDFSYESGQSGMLELQSRGVGKLDGLVAANDSMALGALAQLSEMGVRVPQDMAVVGFDDVPEGRWGRPSLSTVSQSLDEIAAHALEQVVALIQGQSGSSLTQVAAQLKVRESCGCRGDSGSAKASENGSKATGALALAIEGALLNVAPGGSKALPIDWRRTLAQRFAWQVEEGSGQFLPTLEDFLRTAGDSRSDLGDWQQVVTVLRAELTPPQRQRQESTLFLARVLVGEAAERCQAEARIQSEWLVQASLDAGSEVFGSFSEERMFTALAERFPTMGIGACLVVAYEGLGQTARRAVFAYACGGRVPLPPFGLELESGQLYPTELGFESVGVLTASSLYSGDQFIGMVLLEEGPAVGQVYDWLRQQVGVALEGARQLRLVASQAAQRGEWQRRKLTDELEVAARIQRSVLPSVFDVPGLDIAAQMVSASEVGGDCYDVLPVAGGCWFSIGDVAGHGLGPGVVMMSLQSSVAALVHAQPEASPVEILAVANSVLFDVVRRRLGRDEHATMTLIRYEETGRCVFAGAHEDLIVYRARLGKVVLIDTPGPWLGILPDIADATELGEFSLEPGDVLLLYTDGVLEAMNPQGEQFGMDRLVDELSQTHSSPAEAIVVRLLQRVRAWTGQLVDDVTLVAIRQLEYRPSLVC